MSVARSDWSEGSAPVRCLTPARRGLAADPTGFGSSLWDVKTETRWVAHVHDDHELVHVLSGSFTLESDNVSWLVPPIVGLEE